MPASFIFLDPGQLASSLFAFIHARKAFTMRSLPCRAWLASISRGASCHASQLAARSNENVPILNGNIRAQMESSPMKWNRPASGLIFKRKTGKE